MRWASDTTILKAQDRSADGQCCSSTSSTPGKAIAYADGLAQAIGLDMALDR
ncbi:hypothetical protein [Xanthobacter sp. VNH20]|uniref:hypothetical protein n=1 Tax=Xanthobacter sp. VNH20 TaxID=3156616 RepID=UPI0032B370E1